MARMRGERVARFRYRTRARVPHLRGGRDCVMFCRLHDGCPKNDCIEADGEFLESMWKNLEPKPGNFYVLLEIVDP